VYQLRPSGRLIASVQIRVVINHSRSFLSITALRSSQGKFQAVSAVSTFKVASWGPFP
jgi:hypothetical protein